jgi:hypothetical protein
MAWPIGTSTPELIVFGTIKFPVKPIAYRNDTRNITYAIIPYNKEINLPMKSST